MEIKAVLFDLDGTLLPMDYDKFIEYYFGLLAKKMAGMGYEPTDIVKNIWKSTKAMVMNDGSCKNEEAFWRSFAEIYGEKVLQDKPVFDAFYANEFEQVQAACGFTSSANEIVELVKNSGRMAVLATNPLFPATATQARIRWAGLSTEDFRLYTTYENSCHCKPNTKYYLDICEEIGCKPEECLMVGNDVDEDMIAETIGMKIFLLTDCIINKSGQDISKYPNGGFKELEEYIKQLK